MIYTLKIFQLLWTSLTEQELKFQHLQRPMGLTARGLKLKLKKSAEDILKKAEQIIRVKARWCRL